MFTSPDIRKGFPRITTPRRTLVFGGMAAALGLGRRMVKEFTPYGISKNAVEKILNKQQGAGNYDLKFLANERSFGGCRLISPYGQSLEQNPYIFGSNVYDEQQLADLTIGTTELKTEPWTWMAQMSGPTDELGTLDMLIPELELPPERFFFGFSNHHEFNRGVERFDYMSAFQITVDNQPYVAVTLVTRNPFTPPGAAPLNPLTGGSLYSPPTYNRFRLLVTDLKGQVQAQKTVVGQHWDASDLAINPHSSGNFPA